MPRFMQVGLAAVVTGALATVACLFTHQLSLPATDAAADSPFWLILLNPLVLMFAVPIGLLGVIVALPIALWAMKSAELRHALPFVAAVTIVTAMVCTPVLSIFAALPTLIVGIIALLAVRLGRLFPLEPREWPYG